MPYLDSVVHLGHILTFSLDDKDDMNRKANFIFCKFHVAGPFTKCFLFKSYCLSLYGATLWSLSSPSIRLIEVALNNILREVWNLSFKSHTGSVHSVAQIPTISNILYDHFWSFFSRAVSFSSSFVRSILTDSSNYVYTFTGYNVVLGYDHYRHFMDSDFCSAGIIRQLRSLYGSYSTCKGIVTTLCCSTS